MVLVIIAVLASVIVLSFADDSDVRELRTSAERMAHVIELARNEATTQNQTWVLYVSRDSYGFFKKSQENDNWEMIRRNPFQYKALGTDVTLANSTEFDRPVQTSGTAEFGLSPAVLIFAGGETTPFLLQLASATTDTVYSVSSDGIQRSYVQMIDV